MILLLSYIILLTSYVKQGEINNRFYIDFSSGFFAVQKHFA